MDLRPPFRPTAPVKTLINIGCLFDIPTGEYTQGIHGEWILNGGLGYLTGIVGIGNSFKSTMLHYMMLTAFARMGLKSTASTYDTEINIHESRLKHLYSSIDILKGEDIIETGRWVITDNREYTGDEYYDSLKEYMENKRKHEKSLLRKTPFFNRERTGPLEIIQPTYSQIDSFSEFTTKDVIKMQDENSLGESGGNTIMMRQGLQKSRFLMEIPSLAGGSQNYVLTTAHLGSEFNMDPRNPAPKKLQYIPQGFKIKGAPEKFTFIMNNCWLAYSATKLQNDSTKAPEYPRDSDDDLKGDTDLSVVKVVQLRGKSGPTGMTMEIVVSQKDGVLPSLTEFHYLKNNDRFGLEGNLQNYTLALCPDIKLSRTAVRGKIEKHPELRRALNICAELSQITDLWHHVDPELLCSPKQLYDDMIALGYDWKVLLNTRGWWTLEGEFEDIPYLSTMDILMARKGRYIPYWMENPPAKAVELNNAYKEQLAREKEASRA